MFELTCNKKLSKTVVALKKYTQLYKMFTMCRVLTNVFIIELPFNQIVPKELISKSSLNSVNLEKLDYQNGFARILIIMNKTIHYLFFSKINDFFSLLDF